VFDEDTVKSLCHNDHCVHIGSVAYPTASEYGEDYFEKWLDSLSVGKPEVYRLKKQLKEKWSLDTLALQYVLFNDVQIQYFADALPFMKNLQTLKFHRNNIGAKALASALKESNIINLYLSENNIGAKGAKALASALNYMQITSLGLRYNNIGDRLKK